MGVSQITILNVPNVCPVWAIVNKDIGYFAQCWFPPKHNNVAIMRWSCVGRDLSFEYSIDVVKHIHGIWGKKYYIAGFFGLSVVYCVSCVARPYSLTYHIHAKYD